MISANRERATSGAAIINGSTSIVQARNGSEVDLVSTELRQLFDTSTTFAVVHSGNGNNSMSTR
jgi:ABC-type uncharacterized transport system ATPase subunit